MIEIKYGVPVYCVAYLARLHCRWVRGVTFIGISARFRRSKASIDRIRQCA